MPLKCDELGHVCVIAVGAEVTSVEAAELQGAVGQSLAAARAVNFVIDFERARFIGSDGLEALLAIRRRCQERRGQVMLAALDDNCRKILQITRLDHQFECHRDVAAALKAVGSS